MNKRNIMVCVTQQKTCDRLIKRGVKVLKKDDENDGELFVIHVAKEGFKFLGKSKEGEALEYLFQKAKEYGANLTVVRSADVLKTLEDLINKNEINYIVLGESLEESKDKSIVNKLKTRINQEIIIEEVPSNT